MKLKLTDLSSGQEFLLLVTKINIKGLLVQAASTLVPGTEVEMILTLKEGAPPLNIRGEVHKIAERAGGQKGMVIRFLHPSANVVRAIEASISGKSQHEASESQDYEASEDHKTIMVEEDTLSALGFSPPQNPSKKRKETRATVDEETARQKVTDFAEETRMVAKAEFDSFIRKSRKKGIRSWFLPFLFVLGGIAGIYFYLGRADKQPTPTPETSLTPISDAPTASPQDETATSDQTAAQQIQPTLEPPPPPTFAPTVVPAELKRIVVEETPTFLKIVLEGSGLSSAEATRMMNPRRLVLNLKRVKSFKTKPTISVGKNPLLRIRTLQAGAAVQVILDLYPVDFPRYDVKAKSDSVSVYLYR